MINLTRFLCQICLTGKSDENDYLYVQNMEAHQEPSQTSKMDLFANIAITWKPLTIFATNSILNNWLGSKYPFEFQKLFYTNVQEH